MKRETLVDIIIPIHDQPGWVDLCVRAVENFTKNPYRIIIVDGASIEPRTHELLKEIESRGHTVIRLGENRSFSHAVNIGVHAGSSKFICILNDDVIVLEGWDSHMLQDASEKMTGLVGARSNYVTGAQGDPGFIGEPPYLVFICVMMRRNVWDAVGPMDEETFQNWSSEDIDYAWRVKKAGYNLKVSNAFVLHAGSRTISAAMPDPEAQRRNNEKYNARLIDKWGKEWVAAHSKLVGRVLVASYHADVWTRVAFMGAFAGLKRSDGVTFSFYHQTRAPIHMARQLLCDYALDQGFDWLVQLDDDAIFPSDLIRRLLSHQKDVVCALAYQRKPPHLPCAFEIGPDGILGAPMEGIEHTGLRRVDASGFHCSILRTSVIKRMRDGTRDVPGTRLYFGGFENKVGEDWAFSLNCKKYGIQIYCDTDLISGHIGEAIVVDHEYRKAWQAQQLPSGQR